MREHKGLVRFCLHVQDGYIDAEVYPTPALHTSSTTNRRCLASPALVLSLTNVTLLRGKKKKLGLGTVCEVLLIFQDTL